MTSRIVTRLAALFGTSMPTADLPGMGASMRRGAAARARERSFWSAVMRFTWTPAPGCTSNWVTAGPGFTPITLASTPNCWRVLSITLTLRLISSAIRSRRAVTVSRSAIEGSFQSISGRSSSGSATTRSVGTGLSSPSSATATATGSCRGALTSGSSTSSMSQSFFWSAAAGAVAKLAAERVSASELGAGLAGLVFSGAGVATRSRSRACSAFAARKAPTAVTSNAPGLKWIVTTRPITRPATRRAPAPTPVNRLVSASSIPSPIDPPACRETRLKRPTSESTATSPATTSTVRGRGAFVHKSHALKATAAMTGTNHALPKADSIPSRMPPSIKPA